MRAADASLKATDESPPHLVDSKPHHAVSTATSESRITATSSCVCACRAGPSGWAFAAPFSSMPDTVLPPTPEGSERSHPIRVKVLASGVIR